MAVFSIAHVSDLHISVRSQSKHVYEYIKTCISERSLPVNLVRDGRIGFSQGSHCPDVARAAAKFLSRNLSDHQILLVSGDLAATGVDADLDRASRYLNARSGKKRQYLTELDAPTLGFRAKKAVIPGNHDRFQNNRCLSNGKNFDQKFAREWGSPPSGVRTAVLTDTVSQRKLRLVMGDFCLRANGEAFPSIGGFHCGQGTVNSETLEGMISKTEQLRRGCPNDGIVWVSHFPPTGALARFLPELTLQGWPLVVEAASNLGVKYIIAGHIHEPTRFKEGSVEIICAGALCTFFEKGGNWIHSLKFEVDGGDTRLLNRENFQYDVNRGVFDLIR